MKKRRPALMAVYRRLYGRFGPQGWWPGDTPFEIMLGAILTQNTAWSNVEMAIGNLKREGLLSSPRRLSELGPGRLERLIRPAGYYNVKSARIRNLLEHIGSKYGYSLRKMFRRRTESLRKELLGINGIGPETCDSMLLYAFNRAVFVVDAYTKRIFSRHGLFLADLDYEDVRGIFMSNLPKEAKLYNEYHALIVRLGKEFCAPRPDCKECPLKGVDLTCA